MERRRDGSAALTVPLAVKDTDRFRAMRTKDKMNQSETGYPPRQGLYDPQNERDACGFGFVVDVKGRASHDIVETGADRPRQPRAPRRGRGGEEHRRRRRPAPADASRLPQAEADPLGIELPRPGHYAAGMVFLPTNEAGQDACVRSSSRW